MPIRPAKPRLRQRWQPLGLYKVSTGSVKRSSCRFSFGDGSYARHLELGCTPLAVTDASTLRRDVDTADQLAAAQSLGLGPRTAALLGG